MIAQEIIGGELDTFFEVATTVFRKIRYYGIAQLEVSDILFKHKNTQKFFAACVDILKCALIPDNYNAVLEWKMVSVIVEAEGHLTDRELLELVLLKKIFQYYSSQDTESFLDMCMQLCSHNCYNHCESLLSKN